MTYFDMFNLAVSIIVLILTGLVTFNLIIHRKSWFLIAFFGVFAEASFLSLVLLLIEPPEWIWMLRVVNAIIWIGAFIGLIYEAQVDKFDSPADKFDSPADS